MFCSGRKIIEKIIDRLRESRMVMRIEGSHENEKNKNTHLDRIKER